MDNQSNVDQEKVDTPPADTTATVQHSGAEESNSEDFSKATQDIASDSNILERFSKVLEACGVVGETIIGQLCYLVLTSRFLPRPVSLAVKGPSSGGKSYITEQVLRFFPESAYYSLTAMSERALAYSEEDLRHRFLVLFEAESLKGDMASYLMRSLLSEGRIRYETVVSTNTGLRPQLIEREGPTGLLVTTTATSLHPENETRFLSVTVQDTPEQTKEIMKLMALDKRPTLDLAEWASFQEWLVGAKCRVTIPYALTIAELSTPAGVRLRRDFQLLMNLIKANAILHQLSREYDKDGRIVANLDDYRTVHRLVAGIISEGLGVVVSRTVRETVNAVVEEPSEDCSMYTYTSLATVRKNLGIDKSSASRRVRQAIKAGYLINEEGTRGKPMRLRIGDPMPEEVQVLPTPEQLEKAIGERDKDPTAVWM